MYEWAEFRHFKYLLAILELKGFRAAAEQLFTAQSNLSTQSKQFQENAAVRLYHKSKDGRIRPTATGEAFKFIAKTVLDTREEAIQALVAIDRGGINSVRFGSSALVDPLFFQTLCKMQRQFLPGCSILPEHGDTVQLVEEVQAGIIDVAIVTLPIEEGTLRVEDLRRDRLVVCLRKDHPCTSKHALHISDLKDNLKILYHPERHPRAHARLIEMLASEGIEMNGYSRASHPTEMQSLVKNGYGFALIREGTSLDAELTTRPVVGVDWTVDTVVISKREPNIKTIPILIRQFVRHLRQGTAHAIDARDQIAQQGSESVPTQLTLL